MQSNLISENNVVNLIKWLLSFSLSLVLEEKNCSDPGGPLNGYRRVVEDTGHLNGRYAKIGTVIAFFCNNSYVLSGNEQRTCQDDGEWSGKQPICIKGSYKLFYHNSRKLLWFYGWCLISFALNKQSHLLRVSCLADSWYWVLQFACSAGCYTQTEKMPVIPEDSTFKQGKECSLRLLLSLF